ncbi:hypothetical protein J3F81_006374 [Coemansia sp. RSA 371]|nr:hypothetical protein J3F81_006374 [Coemansia sp. RSA 371]
MADAGRSCMLGLGIGLGALWALAICSGKNMLTAGMEMGCTRLERFEYADGLPRARRRVLACGLYSHGMLRRKQWSHTGRVPLHFIFRFLHPQQY